MKSNQMKDGIT